MVLAEKNLLGRRGMDFGVATMLLPSKTDLATSPGSCVDIDTLLYKVNILRLNYHRKASYSLINGFFLIFGQQQQQQQWLKHAFSY